MPKYVEYHPSYAARVRDLRFLGATDPEICEALGIGKPLLLHWLAHFEDFAEAYKDGGIRADAKVAGALYKRAVGFKKIKKKMTKDGEMWEEVYFPPDTGACMAFLTNRRSHNWQVRVEHSVTPPAIVDTLSDVEAARRVAFVLAQAMNAPTTIEGESRRITNGNDQPGKPDRERQDASISDDFDGG